MFCCYLFWGLFRVLFVWVFSPLGYDKFNHFLADSLHQETGSLPWQCLGMEALFDFVVDGKAFVLKLNFWWSSLMHDAHPADPDVSVNQVAVPREHLGQRGPGSLVSTQEHCISMWTFAFCLENAFCCHNRVTAKIFFLSTFYNVQKRKKGSKKTYIRITLSTFLLKL